MERIMNSTVDLMGRKVIVGIVVLLTGLGITLAKGDIPPNLLQLLSVIFGGFIVGNVGEHVAGAISARAAPEEAIKDDAVTAQDLQYIAAKVEQLQGTADASASAIANVQQALTMIIQKYKIAE